jgi:hypothetical protein
MLNQSQTGGATDATQINAWLANIATTAKPSGPQNSSSLFGYLDESGIEEVVKEQEDDSLEWAAEHFSELLQKHQGKWVLIRNHHVADSSPDPAALLKRAVARGIKHPLMHCVEAPPPPGLDA